MDLYKDADFTGNLEIFLFANSDYTDEDEGVMVHSRKARRGFPKDDWDTFLQFIQNELEELGIE
eukprot:CAMPEP_0170483902 /NCGR_PEP_ID=MMETSP0208-20121228/3488_1 /TAXON_ID=197538 /ORGANISM="Strombidium inclinatum, Strain S3" /LENGTH=63 /DNA_ID=CAMNT_0010757097 /DNA_START=150 /DNA_END=341 /DNA_ORIENTATION=-